MQCLEHHDCWCSYQNATEDYLVSFLPTVDLLLAGGGYGIDDHLQRQCLLFSLQPPMWCIRLLEVVFCVNVVFLLNMLPGKL